MSRLNLPVCTKHRNQCPADRKGRPVYNNWSANFGLEYSFAGPLYTPTCLISTLIVIFLHFVAKNFIRLFSLSSNDWIFSIEYWIFKVRLRRINFKKIYQKNDGAKRLPQIFNSQYSIVNSGLVGLGFKVTNSIIQICCESWTSKLLISQSSDLPNF